MLFLLSPAKTLDETPLGADAPQTTEPRFAAEAERLASVLAALPPATLRTLLDVSQPLATLNAKRYAGFAAAEGKAAVFAFNGPAYKAIDAARLSGEQLSWVSARLRILCGLYGTVRPLDAVKPYRLEMGSKLEQAKEAGAKTLYALWGDRLARAVAEDVALLPPGERCVVNVASQEYWQAVKPHTEVLGCPVFTMVFATSATVYAKVRCSARPGNCAPSDSQPAGGTGRHRAIRGGAGRHAA